MEALERDVELQALRAALEAAAAGRGGTVVVEGPAGIGKTRLLDAARELADERGFGRLHGIGHEAERALPWGVVRQLVERSTTRYGGAVWEATMAGPAGRALCALDEAPASAGDDDVAFARTLHALWWVAIDLSSTRPLLISVDDAQWADVASQRFLVYLARRIADLPAVLLVGTRPPADVSGPLVELTAGRMATSLAPQPLSAIAVEQLVQRAGGQVAPEVVAAVHVAAGGNPFLTGQLLHELVVQRLDLADPATAPLVQGLAPQRVSRALLAGLSAQAAALAGSAAVLGGRCDLRLAATLAQLDPGAAADATDALVAGHVLTADGATVTFVHPVIREAVLATLRGGQRAALHAAAARELRARGAAAEQVAVHLAHAPAGTLEDGAQVLQAAAASLLAEGDAQTAVSHLERAYEASPADSELRADLGRALLRAGDARSARRHLLAAAGTLASEREAARCRADAAGATLALLGPSAAVAELTEALDTPGTITGESRLLLESQLGVFSAYAPADLARLRPRLERYAELPGNSHEERTLLALTAQQAFYAARPAAEVAALAVRALADGRYFDAGGDRIAWGNAVYALACTDDLDQASREVTHARERLRTGSAPIEYATVCAVAAMIAGRAGDVAAAEAEAAAGVESLVLADAGPPRTALHAILARLAVPAALERGQLAAAQALLDAFDAGADPLASLPVHRLRMARAEVALAGEDAATALRHAKELGELELSSGMDNPALGWRILAALAAQRLGEQEQARELATQQLAAARRWGTRSALGAALRLMARLDGDARVELLEQAVASLEPSPARLELALALGDLGEALRVARRRSDAREPLRRAGELAQALGARRLHSRALEGLTALGDRPRNLMFTGLESLTASERRVAELAGAGRSNRDIAQDLFVSPKTVENHLGRVYVKLGIASRRELVSALG